ncbi:hypothetical protein [Aquimarina algicola]|uniref:DUF4235 domain-containing protein n=1 Tax=Aquimarina algicola TaxID=2589995 RepID=A0A504J5L8_9FLAO|nr:hypothetical protein [Aquimarina algicola]TPN85814.1 hypothetical protein FHK87_11030 [Aquimarina algicola]
MTAKQKFWITTSAGLAIGMAEALVFYNIGRNEKADKFRVQVPKGAELLKTLGMVALTSVLTAELSNQIEKVLDAKMVASLAPAS